MRRDRLAIDTMPMGKNRITGKKGESSGRLIPEYMTVVPAPKSKFSDENVERAYHPTKGWRFRRP